jgi:phage major head subunit gpT-like protein
MNSQGFGNLLEPILKAAFMNKYVEIESFIPKLFNQIKSEKLQETYLGLVGGTGFTPFTGSVSREEFAEDYKKVITNVSYSDSFGVTRDMFNDDQYGIMKQRASELGRLARYSKEVLAASIFNNGFSSAVQTGDAKNLFATDHPIRKGTVASQGNLGTGALTRATLNTARSAMRRFVDPAGKKIVNVPNMLMVPVELESQAIEAVDSVYNGTVNQAGAVADFSSNSVKRFGIEILVNPFLDDANDWFLINTELAKDYLIWQNREPVRLIASEDVDSLVLRETAYYRVACGATEWRWAYGNSVT